MSQVLSPRGWKKGRLQDLVFFQRGFDITQAQQKSGIVPVISSSGITSYHDTSKVPGPGIVIGRKGTLGSIHFTTGDYWPHDTTLWSKDLRGNDPRFVYYFLHTINFRRFDVGNSNPTLNRNHIHDIPIAIPSPGIQSSIVDILSAYDDLIENNRRRMALLEESALLLYREWFIRLRFPGHEHTRITDGVPEGWERLPFSQLAGFVNGYPFKPAELGVVGLPIVKIPELRDGVSDKTPRNEGENIPGKYMLNDGDLLFSWSGTLLIEFWYDGPAILNQHLFRVEPQSQYSRAFLLFALREALPEFSNQTVGATMKHIRKAALTTVTVCIPSHSLLAQFDEFAADVFEQVLNLRRQNQKLSAARDLLLPRLMSGEIAV